MTQKTKLALVYGGRSVEHDVSVISARNIFEHIDTSRFDVFLLWLDKSGKWFLMPDVDKSFDKGRPLHINLDAKNPTFIIQSDRSAFSIDVAFIILHGTDGEDGSIQGFFKLMQIPFVGSGVLGSAISMDKIIAKKLMLQAGIPTAKYAFVYKHENIPSFTMISDRVGTPMIVKPANQGSSVGISKVISEDDYHTALKEAFKYDESVLIEEFIIGRELECSVIGNKEPLASPPGEVELKKGYTIYSFDAKYVDGEATLLHIPAELDDDTVEKIKSVCLKVYNVLCCKEFARVDLFLKKNGEIVVNEVNTLPGFTNISMFPKLCGLMGISYPDLITQLIDMALERNQEIKKLETYFISGLS